MGVPFGVLNTPILAQARQVTSSSPVRIVDNGDRGGFVDKPTYCAVIPMSTTAAAICRHFSREGPSPSGNRARR